MKKNEIISVLRELYNISGFRISLHNHSFEEIAAYPENSLPLCAHIQKMKGEYAKCKNEDAKSGKIVRERKTAIVYKCRFGLTDIICPLHSLGSPAGYLMMGQLRDETVSDDEIIYRLTNAGMDAEEAKKLVCKVPVISNAKTKSFAKIMTICAEYLTLINALPKNRPSTAELTRLYIYENFRERITMADICEALGRTKSALCPAFKEKYGITVIDYLTKLRLEEAKRMLRETNMSISSISDAVGFSDASYFSKVFLKAEGETPTHYKRRITH